MKLPIYLYGHPVLRETAREVDPNAIELKKLVDDMFETMYAAEGVGLAAPQVGESLRLVVIDADVLGEDFPECKGRRLVLVNPVLEVLEGDAVSRSEGCLSLPGLSENVSRVEHIRLSWLDENLQEHSEEMGGFMSRIVQHELDHLEGMVYMDHVSPTRRMLLRGKLRNMVEGKVKCEYRTKCAPKRKK